MTPEQAKEILSVYRPGSADDRDPEFAEALGLARQDAELARWFEDHCAVQQALRSRFRQIAVPEGLKEQIISERRSWLAHQRWARSAKLAAMAAAMALVIAVAWLWLRPTEESFREEANLESYLNRMVSTVLRQYTMTLETNVQSEVRAHLAQNHALADYVLPAALEKIELTGCGVLDWQGKPVSMVCFHSGKPLPGEEKTDIFLFVVDRVAISDAPVGGEPQLAKVNKLMTASWARGDRVYVLATEGDEGLIRQYLN